MTSATLATRRPRTSPGGAKKSKELKWKLAVAAEVALLFGLWELAVSVFKLANPVFVPPPSAIWNSFTEMVADGSLGGHAWFSTQNALIGFVLAVVIGVGSGLALGSSRWVSDIAGPPFWTAYSMPRIAFQPLLVLWMGFGEGPKILIIFLMAVFPVAINTMDGIRGVDPSLVKAARVFGASRTAIFFKVQLWAALPLILTGVRMGVARAMVGIVIGEFIGGSEGLGYLIFRRSADFDLASSLAITLMLVVIANLLMALVSLVRRLIAPWYSEGVTPE
ncbi:ABC transporter permease [Sinosporangium siamense]|uniref:ABC transporter permease n=1 Tax=Sinosporangium siamense TaxID=1367973 RepID=A0A919RAW6_9ACTN|nr:ABC transporter permease [Sinosporangium siamense]GII90538.1 ABC transporter permease [Sinosporangium siamense]